MMLISRWLEQDVAAGLVRKFIGMTSCNGETLVQVEYHNGERWSYLDQNHALATGEIARQQRA